MADENKNLLDTLANTQLPALPSSEPAEPVEPKEVSRAEERGRSPDEVVQGREARLPAEEPAEPPSKPEEKRYEVRGVKYTAKELEAAGLLEDLAVTHGKHQHLQEKYNELAAERGKPPAKEPETQVPTITNEKIAQAYDQAATAILNDLVAKNLLESDLIDAYPRTVQTLVGQLRYAFDLLFDLKSRVEPMIAEVSAAKQTVQSQAVHNAYNQQLDALSKKDAKLYKGLGDPKVRESFTKYLVDEVGATVGQTTGEKAPEFLRKQWIAFNAETIVDAAKNSATEKRQSANKRFVVGESTGSRTGVPDSGELSVLDRLIQNSGKISE